MVSHASNSSLPSVLQLVGVDAGPQEADTWRQVIDLRFGGTRKPLVESSGLQLSATLCAVVYEHTGPCDSVTDSM